MILNMQDAARLLNLSEKKLMKYIKNGDLTASCVDDCYSFNKTELIEWAIRHGIKVSEKKSKKPPSVGADNDVSLGPMLRRGGIHRDIPSKDHDCILWAMIKRLPFPEKVDKNSVFELIRLHESMGITSIGSGIAIPNVGSPIVSGGILTSVSIFFLEEPIALPSPDNIPVEVIFLILSPSARVHLEVLSRLSQDLNKREFIAMLRLGASDEEIFGHLSATETG
ncbi:MAG: PTS sugar transporter subunit IIA [Oligoflexales bacterium]|nr:PTS sugar transporter subunit IIA [Oligoflexales bacterium]